MLPPKRGNSEESPTAANPKFPTKFPFFEDRSASSFRASSRARAPRPPHTARAEALPAAHAGVVAEVALDCEVAFDPEVFAFWRTLRVLPDEVSPRGGPEVSGGARLFPRGGSPCTTGYLPGDEDRFPHCCTTSSNNFSNKLWV
jgi:hypothetical protein